MNNFIFENGKKPFSVKDVSKNTWPVFPVITERILLSFPVLWQTLPMEK